jgi:hypothetical protein
LRFIPASCSEPSITCYFGFCYLAVDPCRFRGKISLYRTSSLPSIDSFIGFILYVTSAPSSIVVCPLQVLKRGIAFPIHRPSVSNVRLHPLHRVFEFPKSLSSHPSVNPRRYRSLTSPQRGDSLSDPCFILGPTASSSSSPSASSNQFPQVTSRVIHRSILIYPIHAFALDPSCSPKHFIRIVSCRPSPLIDVQDIRPRDSTPVFQLFFFKPRPRFVLEFTLHQDFDSRLTVITAFFSQFLLSVGIPARIGLCDVGTPSLKGGIEGY